MVKLALVNYLQEKRTFMKAIEHIKAGISRLTGEIGLLVESKEELTESLIETPDDKSLNEAMDKIEADIDSRKRHIARLHGILEAAKNIDKAAVEAEKKAKRQAAAEQYVKSKEARIPLVEKLPGLVIELLDTLQGIEDHTHTAHRSRLRANLYHEYENRTSTDRILTACGSEVARIMSERGFADKLVFVEARRGGRDKNSKPLTDLAKQAVERAQAIVDMHIND